MPQLDMILLMSVNPGFGGQRFIDGTLEKLAKARRLIEYSGQPIRLEVDGGVKVDNIGRIAQAGADTLRGGIGPVRGRRLHGCRRADEKRTRCRRKEVTTRRVLLFLPPFSPPGRLIPVRCEAQAPGAGTWPGCGRRPGRLGLGKG